MKKIKKSSGIDEETIECGITISLILLSATFIVGMHKINKRVREFEDYMEKSGYYTAVTEDEVTGQERLIKLYPLGYQAKGKGII